MIPESRLHEEFLVFDNLKPSYNRLPVDPNGFYTHVTIRKIALEDSGWQALNEPPLILKDVKRSKNSYPDEVFPE